MTDGDDRSAKEFAAWQAINAQRAQVAASQPPVDWKNMKIDAASLGVEYGPMLTEAQFKAYCQQNSIQPSVMKMPLPPKKKS